MIAIGSTIGTATATTTVVLGLGASLGDRRRQLQRALWGLGQRGVVVEATSAVYETLPLPLPSGVSDVPLPSFLNAAARVSITVPLERLLGHILAVEARLGRIRPDPIRWGPRTIDIDILWRDGPVYVSPSLRVPHPRLLDRDFALRPLLEVAPHATHPIDGHRLDRSPVARAPLRPRFHRL